MIGNYCTWRHGDVYAYAGNSGWYIHAYPLGSNTPWTWRCPTLHDFHVMMLELRRRGFEIPEHAFDQIADQMKEHPCKVYFFSIKSKAEIARITPCGRGYVWESYVVLPKE